MRKTYYIISLGCDKNRVDSEVMMGMLSERGYKRCIKPENADFIIVNTCTFIEEAKKEAIDTILEMASYRKILIVAGCLAERYRKDLERSLPEVSAFLGVMEFRNIADVIERETLKLKKSSFAYPVYPHDTPRILSTPEHYAYVKIADGCSRRCSFCIIPSIRGKQHSRPADDIVEEMKALSRKGVKEFNLLAQDLSHYGKDLASDMNLLKLIEKMEKSLSDVRVRCLYMHPSGIDDDLLHGIADSSVVVPYLDMPIQHIDNSLLSAMRRGTSEKYLRKLIEKIRKIIPECTIRTTVLAGFPGETAEQFGKLRDFIAETCFDRLGVFAFSSEEGTKAHSMHGKINNNTAQKRAAEIMEIQKSISLRKNMALLGKKIKVLVDGKQGKSVTGRMISQAPEVDGCVYMRNCPETMIGNFAQVKLIRAFPYDLEGIIQA